MNFNLDTLKATSILKANQTKLLVQKNSPEILLGLGIAGGITATVLACKATLEAVKIRETYAEKLVNIEKARDDYEEYTDEHYAEDRNRAVGFLIFDLARLYGPSVVIGALSIGALVSGNRILNGRNTALASAYMAANKAYESYRRRVREELGEEVDEYIYSGKKVEGGVKVVDTKGKAVKFDELEADLDGERWDDTPSQYAVFFDSGSVQWREDPTMNEFFLTAQQRVANQLLNVRGHVFLNEIYDALGLPRTSVGQIVGWVKNVGDGFIDFDIYNPANMRQGKFVAGPEGSIVLDFNVSGPIFELI